ncbi:MAG: family 20 glycosylhydrolase [Massiliimalia sp.]|jgi:hexosaminidase
MGILTFSGEVSELMTGIQYLSKDLGYEVGTSGYPVEVRKGEHGLSVTAAKEKAVIEYEEKIQFFRGLRILCARKRQNQWGSCQEVPCFSKNGIMFDMSRNAVMKPEALKMFFRRMAMMGLNLGMMYTEDTYEVDGEPYFGYARGRYSEREIRDLDDYADAFGIELVPCIQTLAHLERVLHWNPMDPVKDTEDILMVGSDATYALLEKMIVSASRPYRSNRIHIGMDEAANLGLGRYLDQNGYESRGNLMEEHLRRVREILQKHGLDAVMWSDMYFRSASPSREYYDPQTVIPQEMVDKAPKDIGLVYWDYYHHDEETYERMLKNHQKFGAPVLFAGGIWTWAGPSANYDKTLQTTIPALTQCRKLGIQEVFATAWGDNGAEASLLTILYGLQIFAEFSYEGKYDEAHVRQAFAETVGADPDSFLHLSQFDHPPFQAEQDQDLEGVTGLCKRILFEDPLIPLFEKDLEGKNLSAYYQDLFTEYAKYAEQEGELKLLYAFYRELANTLYHKCVWREKAAITVRKRNLEQAAMLSEYARTVIAAYESLRKVWRELWFSVSKPYGFEIIDLRMGGQAARFESAAARMGQFAQGDIPDIEELSEEKLPFCDNRCQWEALISACKIAGV